MAKASNNDFPLLARADELVDELRDNAAKALREFDQDAIHQARVATRRLKAALDLMEPVLGGEERKPFSKALKKLRRRLGPLRDLDVMLEHLREMSRLRAHAPAVKWLSENLERARESARTESAEGDRVGQVLARLGTWWGVREEVASARNAIDSLLAEGLHLQLDAFAERANGLVVGSTAAVPGPTKEHKPPEDPHELRIAGKSLRYSLEMAAVEGHELPRKMMKTFKQMQESLGLWHDYVVLSERAMRASLEALLPHHDAALAAGVLDLAKILLRRSDKHLKDFARLWAERGQELSAGIRSQFPLTRPVISAPQKDPGPSDSTETSPPAAPAQDAAASG
jgi:CHAD domain-containing protein